MRGPHHGIGKVWDFMKLITYQQGIVRVSKTLIPGWVGSWSGITKKNRIDR